ncbi:hypothetical protein [Microbulbifer pacificus]|uniref:hypothetical protein n=1 Tax=Microbulbifer pacificus TaxID=407164 RepID=UPI00131A1989|nr:hypothetical protein [Microbulbifer pacificus]
MSITELAVIIARHLSGHGVEVVLVGGLAVEIYTENLYLTKDIDMVDISYQPPAALCKAMEELGFHKKGRVFANPTTDITVEFPSAPLSIGDELVQQTTTVDLPTGQIPILLVEDVVKDRLSAFVHWRDTQSLVQATAILLKHGLKPESFKVYFECENSTDQFHLLQLLYRRGKEYRNFTMIKLENDLAQILLKNL